MILQPRNQNLPDKSSGKADSRPFGSKIVTKTRVRMLTATIANR